MVLSLILLASLCVLFGVFYVAFLTSHPLKMSRHLAGALVAFLLAMLVLGSRFSGQQLWLVGGVALVAFLAGYLGSIMSEVGRPGTSAYVASKGAAKMLTKGMAIDLAPLGISVNAIGPGYFKTELTAPLVAEEKFSAG